MMQFDPNETTKAAENDGFKLLPDGDYDAEIIECEETESKKGDPMFKIKLAIADPNGGGFSHHIYDYISPRWFQKKFKSFFESMGQAQMYESGNIDAALLVHQYVTATITTQAATEQYNANNTVEMYITAEINTAKRMAATAPVTAADDSLPF